MDTSSPSATRRSRYLQRYHAPRSSFSGQVPFDELLVEPFYQLMRLRLLADRMMAEGVTPSLTVVDARVIVVCPAENREYRNVVASTSLARRFPAQRAVEQVMGATLKDPTGVRLVASEDLRSDARRSVSNNSSGICADPDPT